MKKVEKIADERIYIELAKIIRIANKAVKQAKEENKQFGIPDTFWKSGQVYYVLNDGTITTTPPTVMCQ